jgi:hypothetical protein
MQNTTSFNSKTTCRHCKQPGFYSTMLTYEEEENCPCCGLSDRLNISIGRGAMLNSKNDSDIERREKYYYCIHCKMISTDGCMHSTNDKNNIFWQENAHFIIKYKYKGVIYEGSPLFENEYKFRKGVRKMKVLELYCPNSARHENVICTESDVKEASCKVVERCFNRKKSEVLWKSGKVARDVVENVIWRYL